MTNVSRVKRAIGLYEGFALLAMNTAAVFIALNLISLVVLGFVETKPGTLSFGMELLEDLYPEKSRSEVQALLRETWSRGYEYASFVQFREGPYDGEFVNVSAAGFRGEGAWPPDKERTLFVFGGSTTFGYGVADAETIPAQMMRQLRESSVTDLQVYNFGRGNYYSSQERILFESLLLAGERPDVAIFIDGVNEFGHPTDQPKYTGRLAALMNQSQSGRLRELLTSLPVAVLLKTLLPDRFERQQAIKLSSGDGDGAKRVVDRWLANRRLIESAAAAHGVRPLFVWQPSPFFRFDNKEDPLHPEPADPDNAAAFGYAYLEKLLVETPELQRDFLWLADLQQRGSGPRYVDRIHYSARFSGEIAEHIAKTLVSNQ